MSMEFIRKLPIPKDVKAMYPLTEALAAVKQTRDTAIQKVLTGQDSRFLLIIGPCSADRREAVLEYISRLEPVAREVSDKIIVIPRVYTNKPRSSGLGYMGMLHQPDPCGAPDLLNGVIAIRKLHLAILQNFGLTCADELLYPDNYRYFSDLLSYAAVGARSVENQYHRLVSSGLDIPVGMKNPLSGDLSVMYNSVNAARHAHAFLYRGWEVVTSGNPLVHGILRGYQAPDDQSRPNYSYDSLRSICDLFAREPQFRCPLIVDTNHANSGKDYSKQPQIALDVLASRRRNDEIRSAVRGLMIESYLYDGAQSIETAPPGMSITDPCLGWDKTRELIYRLAENL